MCQTLYFAAKIALTDKIEDIMFYASTSNILSKKQGEEK